MVMTFDMHYTYVCMHKKFVTEYYPLVKWEQSYVYTYAYKPTTTLNLAVKIFSCVPIFYTK